MQTFQQLYHYAQRSRRHGQHICRHRSWNDSYGWMSCQLIELPQYARRTLNNLTQPSKTNETSSISICQRSSAHIRQYHQLMISEIADQTVLTIRNIDQTIYTIYEWIVIGFLNDPPICLPRTHRNTTGKSVTYSKDGFVVDTNRLPSRALGSQVKTFQWNSVFVKDKWFIYASSVDVMFRWLD